MESQFNVLTSGIGSLPFTDEKAAVDHVFAAYDVPFLPQLPLASQSYEILPQMAQEVLPLAVLEAIADKEPTRAFALLLASATAFEKGVEQVCQLPCWDFFLRRAREKSHLKFQFIGPLTLARILAPHMPSGLTSQLEEACWVWIDLLSLVTFTLLRSRGQQKIYVIWDDALLVSDCPSYAVRLEQTAAKMGQRGIQWGLHSCATWSVSKVLPLMPRAILATDFTLTSPLSFPEESRDFIAKGGQFMAGIFDTKLDFIELSKAEEILESLVLCLTKLKWSGDLLISGGCGTGLKSVAFETSLAVGMKKAAAL